MGANWRAKASVLVLDSAAATIHSLACLFVVGAGVDAAAVTTADGPIGDEVPGVLAAVGAAEVAVQPMLQFSNYLTDTSVMMVGINGIAVPGSTSEESLARGARAAAFGHAVPEACANAWVALDVVVHDVMDW